MHASFLAVRCCYGGIGWNSSFDIIVTLRPRCMSLHRVVLTEKSLGVLGGATSLARDQHTLAACS